ncbi:MAG: hypothetical protein IPM74_18925 [Crocinitomicaceae bacterium]|nr:hypothetical protein [Crocinitomicaceae bacterium]
MKQNYNFKMLLCAAALSGSAVNAQTLEDVLCNLNLDYANVTALVPSMYNFSYDGVNYINDGGGDMYDGGNYLNTNLQTNIPYSDDAIISSVRLSEQQDSILQEVFQVCLLWQLIWML